MPDNISVGMSSSGVPAGGQLSRDIGAMSDPAKRIAATRDAAMQANTQRNLKATFDEKSAQEVKSLRDQTADHVLKQLHLQEVHDIDPKNDPEGYMQTLADRIKEMEKKAKGVESSGTQNFGAINAYMRVVEILKERLHAMQSEDVGLPAQAKAAPAPAPVAQQVAQPKPTFPSGGSIPMRF